MQAPVFSLHKLHTKAHRLGGMWDTFVIGSILSGQAILTWKQKAAWKVSKAIKTSSPLILEQEVWPHIYLVQRYLRAHASQQVTPEDPARGKPCWGIQLVQPGGYSKWWLSLFPFDSLFFFLCCLSRSNFKSTKKRATQNKTGTLSHLPEKFLL